MKTLGIVQIESKTSPHQSTYFRRLAGKPLIEWVVRQVTDSQLLDGVIVALGDTQPYRDLATLVPLDVEVFFGDANNVMKRFMDAADRFQPESILRVCADNPFVDPALIDRLITVAQNDTQLDYVGYRQRDGAPALDSPLGVLAEWFSTDALRRADRDAPALGDRTQINRYILTHPDAFNVRLIPLPGELDRDDLRLTVDSAEDFERAQEIFDALGPERLDWQRVTEFLDQQPALRKRMAVLNRKTAD